ncbi:T9SS type A sorting domain-containing protein [Fibrella forsythiae]|uniref:T9SS type A sorting domain-containing protein n=1 Tax=Fibrella forsythiae TaxID=2817061 RepID=A0ABS3JMD8_9BACT|nr:T9SS type A sorting domain-containing protein [Fibrella forsythiae]MBO0950623.1 T9SS type A sorting domain-containing protein [Fibrella forsythiae]
MKKQLLVLALVLTTGITHGQNYAQELTLMQPVEAGSVVDQKAIRTITARHRVSQGSITFYTAGQSVLLQPGFVAQAGAVFQAMIGPMTMTGLEETESMLSLRAFPNPFVQHTTLEYTLPTSGRVQHLLVDSQGKVVQQINAEVGESAGVHQARFDGTGLPAGVYLYRIQVGTRSKILRLLKQ